MPKPFEADQRSLEELMHMDGKMAYAIPLYQRRYVWREEQNSKLWDDVVECYENHSNHFLGSLVLMAYEKDEYDKKNQADELEGKDFNVRHVVDGQQRLTSLSLILAALYHDMLEHDAMFKDLPDLDAQAGQDWDTLKSKMRSCLVTDVRDKHSRTGKGYIPRIIPVVEIYEKYKTIVNEEGCGRQLLVEKAFNLQLANVAKLRARDLRSTDSDLVNAPLDSAYDVFEFYDELYRAITSRIKLVRIDCAAGEDAFQVFESLNGTGLSLTSADRIKNVIMGKGASEKHPMPISKIQSEWKRIETLVGGETSRASDTEAFFASYMFVITSKRVPKRRLPQEFTRRYLEEMYGDKGVKAALANLMKVARHYDTIVHRKPFVGSDGKEKRFSPKLANTIEGIFRNNPSQPVVPLLAAAIEYGFEDPRFEEVADVLLVLLVRHKVCQRSTNQLDKFFEKFCERIKTDTATDALRTLRVNTQPDAVFRTSFANLDFDSRSGSDFARARYYLEKIENYLRNKAGNDTLSGDEEYTLEHIIPQDYDSDEWFAGYPEELKRFEEEDYRGQFDGQTVQSIGNMCLLRRPENSSAGNKAFAVKLGRYQQPDEDGKRASETFQLVSQIVDNKMLVNGEDVKVIEDGETFGAEAVRRRANAMARYALEIWKS